MAIPFKNLRSPEFQTWTPTYSASGSMTYTSVTTTLAEYFAIGDIFYFQVTATGTIGGTPSTDVLFSIPVTAASTNYSGGGRVAHDGATGKAGMWFLNSTTEVGIRGYDAGLWIAGSRTFSVQGWIKLA